MKNIIIKIEFENECKNVEFKPLHDFEMSNKKDYVKFLRKKITSDEARILRFVLQTVENELNIGFVL